MNDPFYKKVLVLDVLLNNSVNQTKLIRTTKCNYLTINTHLKELKKSGIVKMYTQDRQKIFYIPEKQKDEVGMFLQLYKKFFNRLH